VAAYATDHPDTGGSQQWSANRDPWGWTKVTSSFPADEVPFEFPGQARLDGTEVKRWTAGTNGCEAKVIQPAIVSNGFRDYDPVAGVYLNRDPLVLASLEWSRTPENRNLYAYAGFNPVDRVDYWGLEVPGSNPILLAAGFLPYIGPTIGIYNALERGDLTMAVVNLGFLAWDLTSGGTASMVRTGLRLSVGVAARQALLKRAASGAAKVTCEAFEREGASVAASGAEFVERSLGAAESALSIAQRGGLHSGFLKQAMGYSRTQLERAASSFQRQIELHEAKMDNPATYIPNWGSMTGVQQQGLMSHWAKEISNFSDQQSIVWSLIGR
jgi:RHS repeat-associated protein